MHSFNDGSESMSVLRCLIKDFRVVLMENANIRSLILLAGKPPKISRIAVHNLVYREEGISSKNREGSGARGDSRGSSAISR